MQNRSDVTRRAFLTSVGAAAVVAGRGLPLGAGVSAAAQDTAVPREIVARNEARVDELLRVQVTDPQSPWRGACPNEFGLHWPHSAARILEALTAAFLTPASKFHKDRVLVERMRLAAGFLDRDQNEKGNITLPISNYESPPDTAFVVRNVAPAAVLARRHGERDLEALTESFLRRAGGGMATGGVHTPNHRWVVSAALAQVNDLYPDPSFVRRIDQWLAETIDINKDGLYSERSTLGYGPTVNNALIIMAAKLERPELLDPVRRNLDATMHLMHPGNEVVTEISRRQDADGRRDRTISRYWFAAQYLAVHDGNGQYATLADLHPDAAGLSEVMEYPELLNRGPERATLPTTYEQELSTVGLTRIRRGETSANLLLDDRRLFSVRRGDAVINGVCFATAFLGKGQFVADTVEKRANGYHLLQRTVEGPYYQPFDPPRQIGASVGEWYGVREQRPKSEISYLDQSATVTELPNGFRVRCRASGPTGMPVSVEINFREGGRFEGVTPAPRVADAWLLAPDGGTYSLGRNQIRFGPGAHPHGYTQVEGTAGKLPGPSVYVTGYVPFDHTIEFDWS
jgi:hypothetical protein